MVRVYSVSSEETEASLREAIADAAAYAVDPLHFVFEIARERGIEIRTIPASGMPDGSVLLVPPPASELDRLVYIVDRLLGPGGCPWDQAQTHDTLKKYLLEEAYEVIDAIELRDEAALEEELGDLLLQPVMHGQISARNGGFDTRSSARAIVDKLIRRHPHVFGETTVADADEVLKNWDQIKKSEKGDPDRSILAGVPRAMPSLHRAYEVSKRAVRAGFEWPDIEGVFAKLDEEERELREALETDDPARIQAELGDLLFTVVNISRWAKVEPEEALRKMVDRFVARFQHMEANAPKPLRELSLEEWDGLWIAAKSATG
jgi:tetrapyrrole methylase family protein/MazG family protein